MIGALAVVFVLGLLIFFHELGHFLVARALHIGIKIFSLGFGRRIFGFQRGSTDYRLSLIPLGGYVKLYGEDSEEEYDPRFREDQNFSKRPPYQRMMVVAAGPLFNLLLACILYFLIFFNVGEQVLTSKIGGVVDNSPAKMAGLKKGDEIIAINDINIKYWHEIVKIISSTKEYPLRLKIKRGNTVFSVEITPKIESYRNIFGEEIKVPRIGIIAANEWIHLNLGPKDALVTSVKQTWVVTKLTFEGIVKLIERVVPIDNIGGPIMIAQMVSQEAKAGIWDLLSLTALISVNLALLNLLPIPVLDGGHLLFYALEIIMRRPLSPRVKEVARKMGLALLITLMMFAVYNDIHRILGQK
jgi:regulator of sigma E protease